MISRQYPIFVSSVFRQIISEYDPNYAAMSLDEAYLDLTEYMKKRSKLSAECRTFPKQVWSRETKTFGIDIEDCVEEIRHQIYLKTALTASAGIYNIQTSYLAAFYALMEWTSCFSVIFRYSMQFAFGQAVKRCKQA